MPSHPPSPSNVIDVADWAADAEFAVFPQGARAKDAVIAPAEAGPWRPGWRHLFKRSKKSYPDQFWGEVIAHRIGTRMGLEVPVAYAAMNSATGFSGALIEWFYDDSVEWFVHAGDALVGLYPDFDRQKGRRHNLLENSVLLRMLSYSPQITMQTNWRQWWAEALLFDALIGNTDRHQDNWGFILRLDGERTNFRLSPLFDNGTSLGHELFIDRVANWSDTRVAQYCARGTHHAKWSTTDTPPIKGHVELLHRTAAEWSEVRDVIRDRLNFTIEDLRESVQDLPSLQLPIPLSEARLAFILRLLEHRLATLQHAFS